jgi:hypothetical protein
MAKFDINVYRCGNILSGWVRFTEFIPDGSCLNTVVTRQITGLEVVGNVANVTAVGALNGVPAKISVTALDDLAGDNLKIVASSLVTDSAVCREYVRQGGVTEGDLVVFSRIQITGVAKGRGAINHDRNVCKFEFSATSTSDGCVQGAINFTENDPRIMSIIPRPLVRITVPKVTMLKIDGKVATLQGPGTFNGKPARVTVYVEDKYTPGTQTFVAVSDLFVIEAVLETGAVYAVKGLLVNGDIVVMDLIRNLDTK